MKEEQLKDLDFGIEISNNLINRINKINDCLKKADIDNSILLKEKVFLNQLDLDFFMNNLLISFGQEGLDEFQLTYANKAISEIKNKIPDNEVYLNLYEDDNGYYFIILSTIIDEKSHPLLLVDFYLKQMYHMEDENLNNLLNQIDYLNEEINQLQIYYEKLEQSKDNPLHYAGENSIKMMDMLIRKKKYAEEITVEKNNTLNSINDYTSKIYETKAILSEMEMDRIKCSILIDKYISRLSKYYNFTIVKKEYNELNQIDFGDIDQLDLSLLDFSNNP